MPTLSSLHATGQFTAPSSNSVSYSMSAHNPTSYANPVSSYSTNAYGLSNTHQVTFTNPVSAPMVNSVGLSNTLSGLQNNLHNLTSNVSALNLGSAMTGTGLTGNIGASAMSSVLNNTTTSLPGGFTGTLGGIPSSVAGSLGNALSNLAAANQLGAMNASLNAYSSGTGTYTNPLLSSTGLTNNPLNIKLKPLDEIDLLGRYGTTSGVNRVVTPVTPHQPSWNLGLDSQYGTDRVGGLDGFSHDRNRGLSRVMTNTGLDLDGWYYQNLLYYTKIRC